MTQKLPKARASLYLLTLVVLASLGLLIYVAYEETLKTYPRFHEDRLKAEGETLQSSVESMLQAGVPLGQIVGFDSLSQRLLEADPTLAAITVIGQNGATVFDVAGPAAAGGADSGDRIRVNLPLRNKFAEVGTLTLAMPKSIVTEAVETQFQRLIALGFLLTAGFGVLLLGTRGQAPERLRRRVNLAYTATYATMGAAVIAVMVLLYADGVQGKTAALANSLAQRLGQIFVLGLELEDFEGIDQTLSVYHSLNPEVSEITLTTGGQVLLGTTQGDAGTQWRSNPSDYEHIVVLASDGSGSAAELRLVVAIPASVLLWEIARSAKNFAVLFVACALLAHLFLRLAVPPGPAAAAPALVRREPRFFGDPDEPELKPTPSSTPSTAIPPLALIPPFFFLAVFAEGLNASFLPRLLEDAATAQALSESSAAWLFMTFFLGFAAVLLPAGRFADARGPRPLLIGGMSLAAIGLALMAVGGDLWSILAARLISGIGQGILFIGVQGYILRAAPPGQRTQGAAIIVFGFNGGMISGSAMGALLVTHIGAPGIFALAAAVASATALYAAFLIPLVSTERPDDQTKATPLAFSRALAALCRDSSFIKTTLLVGLPTKAVLTGVVMFALPLLLTEADFAQEDIGLVIMFYAGGVLIASHKVSKLVDQKGRGGAVLFAGCLVSGLALVLTGVGIVGAPPALAGLPFAEEALISLGTALLGLSHGFINAPVVTQVSRSPAAEVIGTSTLTATYRLLERGGHVAGPLILGQLLLVGGQQAILYVGLAILGLALLYRLLLPAETPPETSLEPALEKHGDAS